MEVGAGQLQHISAYDEDMMIEHRSYTHNLSSWEIKAWKNSGLKGIRTHDLWGISTML